MNPRSFCPQCTQAWDRPWYDICPHCNYRFKGFPWWMSPSLIVFLICLPAVAIVSFRLLSEIVPGIGELKLESVATAIAIFGIPFGSFAAAVILPLRMGKTGLAVPGWTIVWAVLFGLVSTTLCFFSCTFSIR